MGFLNFVKLNPTQIFSDPQQLRLPKAGNFNLNLKIIDKSTQTKTQHSSKNKTATSKEIKILNLIKLNSRPLSQVLPHSIQLNIKYRSQSYETFYTLRQFNKCVLKHEKNLSTHKDVGHYFRMLHIRIKYLTKVESLISSLVTLPY